MSTRAVEHPHPSWHGLAWLGWAIAAVAAVQLASSPLYLGLVVAVSAVVVAVWARDGARAKMFAILMTWTAVFGATRVVLSALTVHGDDHVILTTPSFQVPRILGGFTVGGPVDAGTLALAGSQALAIVAIVAVFAAFNAVSPHRDLVEALPRSFFEIGVALAVALGFVPSLTKAISDARQADLARTGGRAVRRRRIPRILMPVLETGLERAILLSESMDSRGFARRKATRRDIIAAWIAAGALACIGGALVALVARSRPTAVVMVAAGLAALVLAVWISAAGAPARYRPRTMGTSDFCMIVVAWIAPAGVWTAAVFGDSSLAWPAERLSWPVMSPLALAGLLALLAPVVMRPDPRARRTPDQDGDTSPDPAPHCSAGKPVAIHRVGFSFPDGTRALSGISLDIEPGESVLVIGDSGSGKSSLLRAINGMVPHSTGGLLAGEVTVGAVSTRTNRPRDFAGMVGFVHQDPEAHFVVDEIEGDLAFGPRNLGFGPKEIRRRVYEVAERFGIAHLLHRAPATLSGGEKQRCAIAAAVACRPSVLVLDEPTAQLDPDGTEAVFASIGDLADDKGITVVLAEHRLERAARIATKTVLMERGAVVACGKAPEVIPRYDGAPEVTAVGRLLGWEPPPVTVEDAKALVSLMHPGKSPRLRTPDRRFDSPTPGSTLLAARGLSVAFDGTKALELVDFDLASGEVVALLGRNGSGKTTLLRCLAGLLHPDTGTLTKRSRASYVPQEPGALLFAASVREEIASTLELMGVKNQGASAEVDRLLDMLGLWHLRLRHPRSLSWGERQRLAIAAVAVSGAEVLLLDEPTRGIDAASRKALCDFVPAHAGGGGAVVVATHDPDLAAAIATRVVIVDAGEIVADGHPRRVLPGTPFEPQVYSVLPPFLTAGEVERELAAVG